jgi:hypothetical protein
MKIFLNRSWKGNFLCRSWKVSRPQGEPVHNMTDKNNQVHSHIVCLTWSEASPVFPHLKTHWLRFVRIIQKHETMTYSLVPIGSHKKVSLYNTLRIYKNGTIGLTLEQFFGRVSSETSFVSYFAKHETKQVSCFAKQTCCFAKFRFEAKQAVSHVLLFFKRNATARFACFVKKFHQILSFIKKIVDVG